MQRPATATTFGILNICFAALGLFGIFFSIVMFAMPTAMDNPALRIMHENPAYRTWLMLSLPLGLLGCMALLAAGIGLLLMHEWARKLSIGYAIFAIIFGIIGTVANFLFLFRPMIEQYAHEHGPEAVGAMAGAIGGTVGACFGMVYPILTLVFLTRPKLAMAFRSAAVAPPLMSGA